MTTRETIIESVFTVIDDINQLLPKEQQLTKSLDTVLFGKESNLDSLGLVNLIVAIEEIIEDKFQVSLTLANEKAMSQTSSPFKTVESLVNYILLLLAEIDSE